MKSCLWVVVGLACLAVAGCRSNSKLEIELLERQNRLLEDEIYRLREQVIDVRSGMAEGPSMAPLPGQLDLGTISGPPQSTRPSLELAPPAVSRPAPAPARLTPGQPPLLESGEPLGEGELPDILKKYQDSTPSTEGVGPETTDPNGESRRDGNGTTHSRTSDVSGLTLQADSSQATQLVLNRMLTSGYDADGRLGDEGIVVVIEARDALGHGINAPAPVSVVVLDPSMDGPSARVARWDFDVEQTAAMLRRRSPKQGIGLEMEWPDGRPVHDDLHLFVRYTTSDGRNLEADAPIRINLLEEKSAGWTPGPEPTSGQPPDRPAEPRQTSPSPLARTPSPPSPRTALASPRPAPRSVERPAWSPNRP